MSRGCSFAFVLALVAVEGCATSRNRVVPEASLDDAVAELVEAVLASSSMVVRLGKRAFHELQHLPEDEAYRRAVEVMTGNALWADVQEGIGAFLAKRRPVWRGE